LRFRRSCRGCDFGFVSIILLVAAEMIGAEYGIGAYVLSGRQTLMSTDQLIAGWLFWRFWG